MRASGLMTISIQTMMHCSRRICLVACVLVAALAGSCFVGCGGEEGEDSSSNVGTLAPVEALIEVQDQLARAVYEVSKGQEAKSALVSASAALDRAQTEAESVEDSNVSSLLSSAAGEQRALLAAIEQQTKLLPSAEGVLTADEQRPGQMRAALRRLGAAQDLRQLQRSASRSVLRALTEFEASPESEAIDSEEIGTLRHTAEQAGRSLAAEVETAERGLSELKNQLRNRVAALEAPPLVDGPVECGANSNGAIVVINSGSLSCEEAIEVSENSSGAELGSGPPGWNCGLLAITFDGVEVTGASGYGCVNEAGVRLSVHAPNPDPVPTIPADGGGEEECPPGQGFIQGRCIVIETGTEEDG